MYLHHSSGNVGDTDNNKSSYSLRHNSWPNVQIPFRNKNNSSSDVIKLLSFSASCNDDNVSINIGVESNEKIRKTTAFVNGVDHQFQHLE